MLILLTLLFLRNFGNRLLDTVLSVNSGRAETQLVIHDSRGQLQALGKQNEELYTQNGLLREQNKTLKAAIVAIEDLSYLLELEP
jgi:hypothetical protein